MIPEYDRALHEFHRWIRNNTVGTQILARHQVPNGSDFSWV
jgi:hypothetical protein